MTTTRKRKADPKATGFAGYHGFKGEMGAYGSFEVYWLPKDYVGDEEIEAGWFWAAGFPGCMHDGDPSGPFPSSRAAYRDAQSGA